MDAKQRKALERAGFAVGSVAEFLQLTPEEAALVEMRVTLSQAIRQRRIEAGLTQLQLAWLTKSSQSRVAKMEAGDASVSPDLLIRALLTVGANRREVGETLARRISRRRVAA
jgi:ribosome-binding protein aMBF1 (putative translation factor)